MHFNITVLELSKIVVLLVMKHISNRKLFKNYIQLGLPFSLSLLFLKKTLARCSNIFHATGLFLYTMKTSENHSFSIVSRG